MSTKSAMRLRLDITGVVQGVGFRPAVARVAGRHGVSGFVYNDAGSVHCEIEGDESAVQAAVASISADAPPMARIDSICVEQLNPQGGNGFRIIDSRAGDVGRTLVPPDIAMCGDCLREMRDASDRRYRHPFITCTNCGPRYTVITDLPYDRPNTTMVGFTMCAACEAEYRDTEDRRFHAQTIACPDCGPVLRWIGPQNAADPLTAAATALQAGAIVAVKGIGGFHLACRADHDDALATLRRRKGRPAKPFAVMAADLDAARAIAHVDDTAARLLGSSAAPIVLAPARGAVAEAVAPGLVDLGVLLAYSPIHHLLFEKLGPVPLVMTSANRGGSPIVYDDANLAWIDGLADGILTHDRPIHTPCEDSVLGVDATGNAVPLRRSRGYAPLPVVVGPGGPQAILATGGDLKTTFCLLATNGQAHLSSHLGDMADPRVQGCFEDAVTRLTAMTDTHPRIVACDLHPGYATTGWARRHRPPGGIRQVQHHHAHAVSLLAEHSRLGESMLAVTYDGTGYGTDGTVWGGELLAVGADPSQFTRVGHLAPFGLPGGDGAVRQPARIALDLLWRAGIDWDDVPGLGRTVGLAGRRILAQQIPRGTGCVPTTSMGRLFDAVASLLDVCQDVSYEGQAAIELEHLARGGDSGCLTMAFDVDSGVLDHRPVVRGLVGGLRDGVGIPDLAASFHHAVIAATVVAASDRAAAASMRTIGLTGGVFANRLLLDGVTAGLTGRGFDVLSHRLVPCNDGGLALGQAVIASTAERSGACASESPAR